MIRVILCLLAVLTISSCEKTKEPVVFNYQVESTFRVSTNLQLIAAHALPSSTVLNPTDSVLTANGFSMDQVKEIVIDSLYITTIDTTDTDLQFLRELDLQLEGGSADKMLIGTTGDLSASIGDTVGLNATTRDLKTFLSTDSVTIWPELIIDQTVLTPTTVQVIMELTAEIKEQ